MKRSVALFGSTGSIGTQCLQLVQQFPDLFEVDLLTANKNIDKLREQIKTFSPKSVSIGSESDAKTVKEEFPDVEVYWGNDGLLECARSPHSDLVVMGIMGFAALAPTLAAIRQNKTIALANKESIVTAGHLFKKEIEDSQAKCIPVDSEHNALYQLLTAYDRGDIATIVLTASGGPFFRQPELDLATVTPEQAVKHPNWDMGAKISVDSATMMNKGLELIEAHYLFDFAPRDIEVWVHPQSIVHGAVWFSDNSCIAQLNKPDMRCSIGYAMNAPKRLPQSIEKLSFRDMAKLEFLEPDNDRFPALELARSSISSGPSYPIALNAINEVAVEAFLSGNIRFSDISRLVAEGLEKHLPVRVEGLNDVFTVDETSRIQAAQLMRRFLQ